MDEREDELARLLEHARADAPGEELLSAVRERMLSSVGEAAIAASTHAANATSAASAAPGASSIGLALPLKLIAGVLAVGTTVTLLYTQPFAARAPQPIPRAPAHTAPALPAPQAPSTPLAPAPEPERAGDPTPEPPILAPARPAQRHARRAEKSQATAVAVVQPALETPTKPSFADELGLIKAALAAQRAGRLDEARAKLAEHAQRFPDGQLTNERKRIASRIAQ